MEGGTMSPSVLFLKIYGNNRSLLRTLDKSPEITYPLTRRASIKDIIEALGIPHTEIGRIISGGRDLDFNFTPIGNEYLEFFPFSKETPVTVPTLLRPVPFSKIHFMVDINVLKIARNLRMLGINTTHVPESDLIGIVAKANEEQRILLTRNTDLLKIKSVIFGQLLRSENHLQQMVEVVDRYSLTPLLNPFSRCLNCNALLSDVDKNEILHLLEQLTIKYYDIFKQCKVCKKVYWQGSHHEKMMNTLNSHIFSTTSDT
jgi:uncharacterized protein with PIN domain